MLNALYGYVRYYISIFLIRRLAVGTQQFALNLRNQTTF